MSENPSYEEVPSSNDEADVTDPGVMKFFGNTGRVPRFPKGDNVSFTLVKRGEFAIGTTRSMSGC
ncbi:hypothetical protein CCR75_009030 [Bremia lactucae]|uniref:Uncharacterized protein n=1 Tax=Bremia lactucae TaxID=4779 RepID=A0A976FIH3_BRELC|nr:hypothetical protein CCR75_009030 [Bremia lactucae]